MQADERVTRFGMVNSPDTDRLPVVVVVTLQAMRTEARLVLVAVTSAAIRRDSQERLAHVLDLDVGEFALRDVVHGVTPVAT